MVKGEMNGDPIESEFFSVEHLDAEKIRDFIKNHDHELK